MKINLALKVLILFFSVHVYVFLTGLVYHLLEAKKIKKNTNVIDVLDKYFYNASHGPNVRASIAHSTSKAEVVNELKNAFENDKKEEMRSEFRSLWKSYLFALTTITTVGNSGLYLQSGNSQIFFFFTTAIGTVLYIILLHHVAVFLLGILVQIAQFEVLRIRNKPKSKLPNPFHASISVFLMSYLLMLMSVLIIAIALVVSGHGYLFGLCAVTDSALMIGNYHMLAYLYPWNEGGFVVSMNLILLVCHSFLYTAILATTHFIRGTKWEELIEMYIGDHNLYKPLPQDEEKPYQKFLAQTGVNSDVDAKATESKLVENAEKIEKNKLQEKKSTEEDQIVGDSIVPTLLSPEDEDFWEKTEEEPVKP